LRRLIGTKEHELVAVVADWRRAFRNQTIWWPDTLGAFRFRLGLWLRLWDAV